MIYSLKYEEEKEIKSNELKNKDSYTERKLRLYAANKLPKIVQPEIKKESYYIKEKTKENENQIKEINEEEINETMNDIYYLEKQIFNLDFSENDSEDKEENYSNFNSTENSSRKYSYFQYTNENKNNFYIKNNYYLYQIKMNNSKNMSENENQMMTGQGYDEQNNYGLNANNNSQNNVSRFLSNDYFLGYDNNNNNQPNNNFTYNNYNYNMSLNVPYQSGNNQMEQNQFINTNNNNFLNSYNMTNNNDNSNNINMNMNMNIMQNMNNQNYMSFTNISNKNINSKIYSHQIKPNKSKNLHKNNNNPSMINYINLNNPNQSKEIPNTNMNLNLNPNQNIIQKITNSINDQTNPNNSSTSSTTSLDSILTQIQNEGYHSLENYIKTQKGSREFQKIISKISPQSISKLITQLYTSIPDLMLDRYGNYFCQKLIQNCSPDQRVEILKSVDQKFCTISCNPFGTHSLQVLVEISNIKTEQEIICSYIDKYIQGLSVDQRGTHIIQKFIISCIHDDVKEKLGQIINKNYLFLINNSHGACIIIKMLKFLNCKKEKDNLINLTIENALEVIQNPFGNYVIQTLLNDLFTEEYQACIKILQIIYENFFSLSMQKFSSNVVENSLRFSNTNLLKKILADIIINDKVSSMVKNTYGNFIIEKLIKRLSQSDREEIITKLNLNVNDKNNEIIFELFSH